MGRLILTLLLITSPLLGVDYLKLPDDELLIMAEKDDPAACYYLGAILEQLDEESLRFSLVDKDPFKWYLKSAELGYSQALTKLGKESLTNYGYFGKRDYKKAISYFEKARDGDNEASLLLSVMYYHGLGVDKERELAKNYFRESQKDFYRIQNFIYLEEYTILMIKELVREENPEAIFIVGDLYYFGRSSYYEQDYKKAYRMYSKSGEIGNSSAQYMAGMMCYNGIGTLKDYNQSFNWISKSAEGGNLSAMVKAGIMIYFGEGTQVDHSRAFDFFKKGAMEEDSLAQYFLGVMYYKGEGVEEDPYQSKKWIKMAYDNGSPSAEKFWNAKELWKIVEPGPEMSPGEGEESENSENLDTSTDNLPPVPEPEPSSNKSNESAKDEELPANDEHLETEPQD